MTHRFITAISIVGMTLLCGCAVGPDFTSPQPPPTEVFIDTPLPEETVSTTGSSGLAQHFLPGSPIPDQWWMLFESPCLNSIVAYGLANSPTVEAARATLEQAKANYYAQIGSGLLPSLNWVFSGQRQEFSTASIGGGVDFTAPNAIFNLFNTQVNVAYALDVFGGTRRGIEALKAVVDYQMYELEAAYLMLTANIVTTALTEASIRSQIKATHQLIESQSEQLKIVKQQFTLGAVSRSEVLTQETQLAQLEATLPPLEKSLLLQRHLLSMLIGDLPTEAALPEFELSSLTLPPDLPLNLPSTLVQRRPDIRAAEALMHQACAQVGVATANMFPQFNIISNFGFSADFISSLIAPANEVFLLNMQVAQPVFQGGGLFFKRRAAMAAFDQARAQYREVVLQAFQNVADALRAVEKDAELLAAQRTAEKAAYDQMNLTAKQFKLGAVNYLLLLNAERQYQTTVINRIQAESLRYTDTVALFQALGGGWWNCDTDIG